MQTVLLNSIPFSIGKKKQKEDTFGMNDDDWNVYRDIVCPQG